MKKTIALFLAAALLGVGLIASCSDDPEPAKETPALEKFTVVFDANGGELAKGTKIVVTVDKGKTIGTTNWPADPVKTTVFDYGVVEDDFNGWYDGTKKYSATEPITKDVTLVASYSPFVKPERETEYITALGGFTWVNTSAQQGWRSNGADDKETELDWADIAEARYIVLQTRGGSSKDADVWKTTVGDIQIVAQGDGSGWGWDQTNINSFGYARAADKDTYIVIDLTSLKNYTKFVKGTVGKFLIAYYEGARNVEGLGLQEAYLTNKDLKKDLNASKYLAFAGNDSSSDTSVTGKKRVIGFITQENVLGLTAPTPADLWTVSFNVNGGASTIPATIGDLTALKGKGVGVRFPADPSDPDYVFLGWFDGTVPAMTASTAETAPDASWGTKYDALTKVSKNTTLTAGWQLEPALDKFTIKVGSKDVEILSANVIKGAMTFKAVAGGRLLFGATNWDWEKVAFPVDLGTVKLKDVKKITLKITSITSDALNWKKWYILAGNPIPSGQIKPDSTHTPISLFDLKENVPAGTEYSMEFVIDQAAVTTLSLSELSQFQFSVWANLNAQKYQIKDIVFELN